MHERIFKTEEWYGLTAEYYVYVGIYIMFVTEMCVMYKVSQVLEGIYELHEKISKKCLLNLLKS